MSGQEMLSLAADLWLNPGFLLSAAAVVGLFGLAALLVFSDAGFRFVKTVFLPIAVGVLVVMAILVLAILVRIAPGIGM